MGANYLSPQRMLAGLLSLWLAVITARGALASVCLPSNSSSCGALFCDFPVLARPECGFAWPASSGGGPMAFMCTTSGLQGTCRPCPPGWTASGAFCVECDPLKSCNRNGTIACGGACAAGKFPTCEYATGRVSCQACKVDSAALALDHRSLTRGGVLDAPDLCSAYFECYTGYYLATQASTGGLTCLPCEFPEASAAGRAFVSRGLTFGDKYSCLYAALRPRVNNNSLGEYGTPLRSCPAGKTSEPGMGVNESSCVDCPLRPAFGWFGPACHPLCQPGRVQRGESCVLPEPDCDSADGYSRLEGGACAPSPLPWSSPGWQASGAVSVSTAARPEQWVALDADGDFRVSRGAGVLARQGVADFCSGLRSVIENKGYVQDKPLFTQACGDVESHGFYLLVSTAKYLYAFLERSFGNNNRFIMWQVQKNRVSPFPAGQVWQTFRMPAKVCSAVVVPGDYVYVALCGATFISFAKQLDYMPPNTATDPENAPFSLGGTQYVLGRRLGVLIGQEDAGNADGMLPQALFRGPLSIATTSDPSRLLVADLGNCRIAEVAVDFPGSFLTRATTVGAAACFSGDFPLPYPRGIVAVLGGAAALFLTDRGLVQLDAGSRRYALVMSAAELGKAVEEIKWIRVELGGEQLVLENETHTAVVTRTQTSCPSRSKARRGGSCSACATGTFSTGEACVPCSSLQCQPGQKLVVCSDSADARCEACAAPTVAFPFRFGQDCQVIPKFPCPAGYYGLDDCYPCIAVSFRQWPHHAYCQCLGYPLLDNGTACSVPSPWPESPPWLQQMKCDYQLDANCSLSACFLASVQPRSCLPCPAGSHTADGLFCVPCPGFREPSPARDACVCRAPAVASPDDSTCVCPPGNAAGGAGGCSPCPLGTVKAASTTLPDDYAGLQGGSCLLCPSGQEPSVGSTACKDCAPGLYREGTMAQCERCSVGTAAYAADPARASSCVACEEGCQDGQRWSVCPTNSSYFACEPCPAVAVNRELVGGGRLCEWRCKAGYYEYNGDCFPCTRTVCQNGFKLTQCSRYEDSHCRVPCSDETKPLENSVWINDCYWDCDVGYMKILKEYPGWAEYACVKYDYVPWSLGF